MLANKNPLREDFFARERWEFEKGILPAFFSKGLSIQSIKKEISA
jgi:hypothetical protein